MLYAPPAFPVAFPDPFACWPPPPRHGEPPPPPAAPPPPPGPRPGDVLVFGAGRKIGHCAILVMIPGAVATPAEARIVREARRWVGLGRYKLGAGGRRPDDGTPFDRYGYCDCSGFVCHVLGIDRFENDRWWNTDAIEADGRKPGGRWAPVEPGELDLAKCRAVHCRSGGRGPAVIESSAAQWKGQTICRLVAR